MFRQHTEEEAEAVINLCKNCFPQLPGSHFGLGSHKVTYVASDAAGYSTECVFRILVRLPKWKYFNYLQLPRDI